jgi:hypothetical protein
MGHRRATCVQGYIVMYLTEDMPQLRCGGGSQPLNHTHCNSTCYHTHDQPQAKAHLTGGKPLNLCPALQAASRLNLGPPRTPE